MQQCSNEGKDLRRRRIEVLNGVPISRTLANKCYGDKSVMRVLLFDIDGTLLITNHGGKGALEQALAEEFGLSHVNTEVEFAGRTDRSILTDLLRNNGIDPTEEHKQRLARRYIDYLPLILRERGGRILPGVTAMLAEIATRNHFTSYVMTGNLAETATHKLKHFGLLEYFSGIFGGDHDLDRDDLARRTAHAIRQRYGHDTVQEWVVIGDTPHDIRCGRAIGAKVIAVCTGSYRRSDLEAENPAAVLDDFSNLSSIKSLLDGP